MATRLIVALTAMLALAGCGGGGSGGGTTAEDIRKRTGSTPPLETADEQRERSGEIVSRADLMMMSPIHGEAANATGLPTFRVLADCSSEACEFGEPSVGFSDYFTIGDLTNNLRAATFALAKHGITLFEIHEGASDGTFTAYGSWMDHSGFSVNAFTSHVFVPFRHGMAGGDLTGERPARDRDMDGSHGRDARHRSATQQPLAGRRRGDLRLLGFAGCVVHQHHGHYEEPRPLNADNPI